jgi:cytochrome c biogenesis protein CcdA
MTGAMTFAFAAGLLATVNPCGFMMLPGFLGLQLRMSEGREERSLLARCAQGAGVGLVLSGAFSGVLVLAGLVLAAGLRSLVHAVPWMVVAVGTGLVIAGVAILGGHGLGLRFTGRLRPGDAGGRGGLGYGRVAAFGAGYAIASLSCTLAVLLSVATQATATANPLQVLAVFGALAAGATSALLALSLSVALAKGLIARVMHRLAPVMDTISGVMLAGSGLYLIVYWLPSLLDDDARPGGPIAERVDEVSRTVTNFAAAHTGAFAIGLAVAAALAAGLTFREIRSP